MIKIILATSSPYRIKAFQTLGIPFTAETSNVDENHPSRPNSPEELVSYLATLKAEAVAQNHKEGIVIGFDSVGYYNNIILEKTKSREEAEKRLQMLSGKELCYFTGVHLIDLTNKIIRTEIIKTKVKIRIITDIEINKYINQDSLYTTYALGFHPSQFYSASFIERIDGSLHNILVGLPLEKMMQMLAEEGIKIG